MVSPEETILNLNRFELTLFQEDDIFQYHTVINSVWPSCPFLSSIVLLKRSQSYFPLVL